MANKFGIVDVYCYPPEYLSQEEKEAMIKAVEPVLESVQGAINEDLKQVIDLRLC